MKSRYSGCWSGFIYIVLWYFLKNWTCYDNFPISMCTPKETSVMHFSSCFWQKPSLSVFSFSIPSFETPPPLRTSLLNEVMCSRSWYPREDCLTICRLQRTLTWTATNGWSRTIRTVPAPFTAPRKCFLLVRGVWQTVLTLLPPLSTPTHGTKMQRIQS